MKQKRLIAFLLTVCMVVSMMPSNIFGALAASSDGYTVDDAKSYTYDFAAVGKATLAADQASVLNIHKDMRFAEYTASQIAGGNSAPWKFYAADTSMSYYTVNERYGVFLFTTAGQTKYVRLQIQVGKTGWYLPSMLVNQYGSSAETDVFVAPVGTLDGYEAEQYFAMRIPRTNTGAVKQEKAVAEKPIYLTTGEYILSYRQKYGESNRYLTADSFKLGFVTSGVWFDAKEPLSLAVGEKASLTAISASGSAVSYSSSDSSVLSVSNGTVTAKAAGTATVTATADGQSVTHEVTVYEKIYDYQFTGTAKNAAVVDLKTATEQQVELAGSAPWLWDGHCGKSAIPTFIYASGEYDSIRIYQSSRSSVMEEGDWYRLKIKVEESGTYLPALKHALHHNSAATNVYLAPTTASDPMADDYLVIATENTYRPGASGVKQSVLTEGESELTLTEGEYYLTFEQTSQVAGYCYAYIHDFYLYQIESRAYKFAADKTKFMVESEEEVCLTPIYQGQAVSASDVSNITVTNQNEDTITVAHRVENGELYLNVYGLATGTATITVTGTYKDGTTLYGEIPFVIVQADELYSAEVTAPTTSAEAGDEIQLSASVTQYDGTVLTAEDDGVTFEYESSDTSILSVNDNGLVRAKAKGEAVVSVEITRGESVLQAAIIIEVTTDYPLVSVSLSGLDGVALGSATEYTVSGRLENSAPMPSDARVEYILVSESTDGVITLSDSGRVYANKVGTAVIQARVTTADGDVVESAEKTITVYDPNEYENEDWFVPGDPAEVYIDFKQYLRNTATPRDYKMEESGWEVNRYYTSEAVMNRDATAFRWQIYGMNVLLENELLCLNVVIPGDGYYQVSVDAGQYGAGAYAEFFMNDQYLGEYVMFGTGNLVSAGEIKLNTVWLNAGVNQIYIKRGTHHASSNRFLYLGSLRFTPVDAMPTEGAVALSAEKTTLSVGESTYLLPGTQMSDGTAKRIGYTSDRQEDPNNKIESLTANNSIVTIGANHKVTAAAVGTSTVTMTALIDGVSYTKTQKITVDSYKLNTVTATLEQPDLRVGDRSAINLTATKTNGNTVDSRDLTVTYTSSDESIAKVENGILKTYQSGDVQITVSATLGNTTKQTVLPVTVQNSTISGLKIKSPYNALNLADEGYQMSVVGTTSGAVEEALSGATVAWSTTTPNLISVSESGFVSPKALGEAVVQANVQYQGNTYELTLTISVRENKTKRTYFNEARMSAVENNIANYKWAQDTRDSAKRAADNWLSKKENMLDYVYENLLPSQEIPRGITVGFRWDPTAYTCKYCGVDLRAEYDRYPYLYDGIAYPWKIQCPSCRRRFPSNDFESFYKTGLDEHGNFNYELALQNGSHLLTNDMYPEKGAGWGVDDSRGYRTGRYYQNLAASVSGYKQKYGVDISQMEETWTFIGYYAHFAIWNGHVTSFMNAMMNAYLYTGDAKYGRVGAILTDRIADLYPEMFIRPWFPWFFNSDSTSSSGKMVGCIWQTSMSTNFAKYYDAFYDMYDDPEVIDYLSQKAIELNLVEDYTVPAYDSWDYNINGYLDPNYTDPLVTKPGNAKNTGALIRKNIEDNLVREVIASVYAGNDWGNFGTHQMSAATAAVVLDSMPETGEVINWLMQTSSDTASSVSGLTGDGRVDGGDILRTIAQKVRRDGSTAENAPGYGTMWPSYLYNTIYALAGYDGYDGANLLENPKVLMMFKQTFPMLLLRKKTATIGDSGDYNGTNSTHLSVPIFMLTEDVEMGQLLYWNNGNTVEGLSAGMFEDSKALQDKIQEIIDEHGEYDFDKSEQATGWGFSIARNGTLLEMASPIDTQRYHYIYYGGTTGHGHPNKLDLGLAAFGIDLTPDFGYPEAADGSYRASYRDRASGIHNVVMVDDKRQTTSDSRGFPLHFHDAERVSVIDVRDLLPYAGTTEEYRRSTVSVEVDNKNAYTIDFYRVKGGSSHTYSFHANSNTIDSTTLKNIEVQKNGTYAGTDVAVGGYNGTGISNGYDFFYDVRRADYPGTEFSVDFLLDQYRGYRTSDDYHLKMTMLNDFDLTEVALAKCQPPQVVGNPDEIEFVLARREGSNLDSLFTTVFEPYDTENYIETQESVAIKRIGGAWENEGDTAKAVKITLKNGRVDYIVYATNKQVRYRVDDCFDFQGFVGVYMLDSADAETPSYTYMNDGTLIGETVGSAEYSGTVDDFTKGAVLENYIVARFNQDCDPEDLVGEYIYIANDGADNGVYEILGASALADGTVKLETGMISFIRGLVDNNNVNKGYTYNIAAGQKFTIPRATIADSSPVFEPMEAVTVDYGKTATVTMSAVSQSDAEVRFELVDDIAGASIEGNVLYFTPTAEQIGKNTIGVSAVVGTLRTTQYVDITVLPPEAAYRYKFTEMYTVGGVYDLQTIKEGAAITETAMKATGSDSWVFDYSSVGTSTFKYLELFQGIYLFASNRTAGSAGGDAVRLKITVPEDGVYLGGLDHRMYGPSAAATVYLAPTTASNLTDEYYRVLHASNANRTNAYVDVYTLGSEELSLKAGEYYLTFVQTDDSGEEFRYFIVHNFDLIRKSDYKPPKTWNVTFAEPDPNHLWTAGETVSFTTVVTPSEAVPGLIWSSSDESIARVDKTGAITLLKEGTVTVTATTSDGSGVSASKTIDVLAKPAYDYKFTEAGEKLLETTGSGDMKAAAARFYNNYSGSALAEGSAPWCYESLTGLLLYLQENFTLGTFTFGKGFHDCGETPNDTSVFKIKVDADGQYLPTLIYNQNTEVPGADIYIAPVADAANMTDEKYLALEITNSDRPTRGPVVRKIQTGTTSLNLKAGEYYLVFKETNDATSGKFRYFFFDNFRLYREGEALEDSISIARPKDQLLAVGDTCALNATVQGTTAGINWSSSDPSVATVDSSGLVTAVGNGHVTITATMAGGSGLSASTPILVGTSAYHEYKFKEVGQAMVAAGAETGDFKTLTAYTSLAGTSPWMYVKGSSTGLLFAYLPANDAFGTFAFNGIGTSEWARIKIKIDKAGVYAGAVLHNHTDISTNANVYFAPVNEVDAGASPTAEKYRFIRIEDNWNFGKPENGFATVSDMAMPLSEGEYYVTFAQNTGGDTTQRYLYLESLQLFRIDDAVSTTNGAAIRTIGKQGLRFYSQIDRDFIEDQNVTEYGMVLIPSAALENPQQLTLDYADAETGYRAASVPAKYLYSDSDPDEIVYTAVLIDVAAKHYKRAITARAYAILGDGTVVYGNTTTRSIYQVAERGLSSSSETEANKEVFRKIVIEADGENGAAYPLVKSAFQKSPAKPSLCRGFFTEKIQHNGI